MGLSLVTVKLREGSLTALLQRYHWRGLLGRRVCQCQLPRGVRQGDLPDVLDQGDDRGS